MFKRISFLAFILFLSTSVLAQRNTADSTIATPWISIQYGANWTSGDLADRHGFFSHIGFFAGYKTKRNWIYGIDASFMFGNNVRTYGIFDLLVDSQGNITDQNGDIAQVFVLSRGMYVNGSIGKILPVLSPNKNSGLYVNFGAGYLAHKVRIETQDQVIPSLELDYRKGYDRLTSGINTHQFLGYALMSNKSFLSFYGGFYVQEGFTYNRRNVFFDQPDTPVSKEMMIDIQYGIKVGWLIPIYKRQPKEYYYN